MAELTAPSPPPTSPPPRGHRSTTPLVRMSLAWDNPSRISPASIALLEFPSCVTEQEEEKSRKDYIRGKSDTGRGISGRRGVKERFLETWIEINWDSEGKRRRREF